MFEILLPKILPIAISLLPLKLAKRLTANSGKEVPKATMVRPINSGDNPDFFAIDDDPRTKKSAPQIKITSPIVNKMILIIIPKHFNFNKK